MIYLIVFILLVIFVWVAYEIKNAPLVDENYNIINKKNNV